MTKTTLPLLSMLTAFALQACAAPTTDVSSDPVTPGGGAADERAASEGAGNEASWMAGSYGGDSHARLANESHTDGTARAGSTASFQLFIASRGVSYDLESFNFSVAAGQNMFSATGGAGASRPQVSDVAFVVAAGSKLPSLSKDLFNAKGLGQVTIRQRDAFGQFVDFAKLDTAMITSATTLANGDRPLEAFTLSMRAVTVFQGKGWAQIDIAQATTSCSDPCPCGAPAGQIGPYAYAASTSTPIAKDAKRVESLEVGVSSSFGKATLDGISVSSVVETSGMCAMLALAQGKPLPSVRFAVVESSPAGPIESTSWEACYAFVDSVSFNSRWDSIGQDMSFDAAGLVRTDRTFDGMKWSSPTSNGWSFAKNASIASCGEVF